MGNLASSISSPVKMLTRKRKHDDINSDSGSDESLDRLLMPKRKKLMTTTHYIYKALYQEGQNSDVTIIALNKEWKLHKVYLCQSHYFASMFSGSWKESDQEVITIEITDENITIKALDLVFGSFYQDEIIIEPLNVVSILAAAVLFQLESLMTQATEIMRETINVQTAVSYYYATSQYGYKDLHKSCFNWLLVNLLGALGDHPKYLREVNQELMIALLNSPDLFVMQTEFATYCILKKWVFLIENENWTGSRDECSDGAHNFFLEHGDVSYLNSTDGKKYEDVFRALRLDHLINHHYDVEILERDKIIPNEWLSNIYRHQWFQMLRIDQGIDKGPTELPEDLFRKSCFRCGRVVLHDGYHLWRWTGFNFGLDLLVTYEKRLFKFKRNHRHDSVSQSSLSPTTKRHIAYRMTVASVDYEQRQTKLMTTTGIKHVLLGKNEEIQVLQLEEEATFPLFISANFMVISPMDKSADEKPTKTKIKTCGSSTQIPSFSHNC
uniref:BTB domain-containing protein n=1 Tax=Strigamia maritima TaxID=126957 RepID=T1IXQ7_STRMM